jgi:phosphotriesterase-related protein
LLSLGKTLLHEHFLFGSPGFEGDSTLGGLYKFLRRPGFAEQSFFEMFMAEINDGIAGTGVKAGVIKVGSSSGKISDYEMPFFKAAARAQKETDIVIITHTTDGSMGPEQAELLIAEGADPNRLIIGHMCGATLANQLKTLKKGVGLGLDRFGLDGAGAPPDEVRIAALLGLVGLGYGSRLALSHDSVVHWLGRQPAPQISTWYTGHLFEDIVPALSKAGLRNSEIEALFVDGVKHAFSA